ncbi:epimerase [Kribbella deserti]|uniref:Epimerase n=1 Tax=Kribbella deserti TaxID=1926257 RepID=A0ABV6QUT3_9ACTN
MSKYLLAGSSGFLGTALTKDLSADGHEVVRLVRRTPRRPDEIRWDPAAGELDPSALDGVDVVINLAGANIGRPWTPTYKAVLRESRVTTTATLARAIAARAATTGGAAGHSAGENSTTDATSDAGAGGADQAPKLPAFLVQSGTGAYGKDRGDEVLTETATTGDGFLAELTRLWSGAADPAREAGARVAVLRTAVVLDSQGPAFQLLSLPFRLGLGGRLGSGTQYFPVISLTDWIRAVRFVADHDELSGPINLGVPNPPTNAELTKSLASALHRPSIVPVPAIAMKAIVGEFAWELLGSKRAEPAALLDAGFTFNDATIDSVLAAALQKQ